MKAAKIVNDKVANIIKVSGHEAADIPEDFLPCPKEVKIGWTYENNKFSPGKMVTIIELKEMAKKDLSHFFTQSRANLTDFADPYKVAGWSEKARRAERVLSGEATLSDSDFIQVEIDKRGKNETHLELAQKQQDKANFLAKAIAVIDGIESAAKDNILSANAEDIVGIINNIKISTESALSELGPQP